VKEGDLVNKEARANVAPAITEKHLERKIEKEKKISLWRTLDHLSVEGDRTLIRAQLMKGKGKMHRESGKTRRMYVSTKREIRRSPDPSESNLSVC